MCEHEVRSDFSLAPGLEHGRDRQVGGSVDVLPIHEDVKCVCVAMRGDGNVPG